VTPLYPEKLALTSPTSGSRLVGIVRLWIEAAELLLCYKLVYSDSECMSRIPSMKNKTMY
jgi:hypothetical protein